MGKFNSILRLIDVKELKKIKVEIKRPYIAEPAKPEPFVRDLGDPYDLIVHRQGKKHIFYRGCLKNSIQTGIALLSFFLIYISMQYSRDIPV